jgi:hypothetical protein
LRGFLGVIECFRPFSTYKRREPLKFGGQEKIGAFYAKRACVSKSSLSPVARGCTASVVGHILQSIPRGSSGWAILYRLPRCSRGSQESLQDRPLDLWKTVLYSIPSLLYRGRSAERSLYSIPSLLLCVHPVPRASAASPFLDRNGRIIPHPPQEMEMLSHPLKSSTGRFFYLTRSALSRYPVVMKRTTITNPKSPPRK